MPKNEDWRADIDLRVAHGMKEGQALGFIKSSDLIIIITGWSKGIITVTLAWEAGKDSITKVTD